MDALTRQRPVALLALAAGLLLAGPASAHAADPPGGGFSARPDKGAPQDRAGTYFAIHSDQGEAEHETVVITNLSSKTKHLLLDPVDGLTGTTSGSVYANREDPLKEAGTWLVPDVKSVTIPPHGEVKVPFTVKVPRSAKAGDHLAGLALQDAHRQHAKSRFAITQIIRVVVGVKIEVDGPSKKAMQLGGLALKPLLGTKVPSVVVDLTSSGTKLCKPLLTVSVANATTPSKTVTRRLDTILPGSSIPYPLPWPNALAAGTYTVAAKVSQCGLTQTTQANLRLGENLRATPANPEANAPLLVVNAGSGMPWWALVGAALMAALLSGGFVAVLLRRRKPGGPTGPAGPPAAA